MKKHFDLKPILMAAAVLAGACTGNESRTVNLENSLNSEPDTIGLESITEKIETVELQCDSLYDIHIFADYDGRLYGTTSDYKLVIFSQDGTLLHAYNRTGRGPGEYVWPDFNYDPFNHEIIVYDSQNKIIRYDADGKFKDEIRNDVTSRLGSIMPIDTDTYVSTVMSFVQRDSSLQYLDRNINVTGNALPIFNQAQLSSEGLILMEPTYLYNSVPMYQPYAEDTYYSWNGTSWQPYLRVDCGKYQMPAELAIAVGKESEKAKYIFINRDYIAGNYYLVSYARYEDLNLHYDVYEMTGGRRLMHNTQTEDEIMAGSDEGFIFRHEGETYRIMPQYVKDNVLYWSRFSEDGGTTLFKLTLKK